MQSSFEILSQTLHFIADVTEAQRIEVTDNVMVKDYVAIRITLFCILSNGSEKGKKECLLSKQILSGTTILLINNYIK